VAAEEVALGDVERLVAVVLPEVEAVQEVHSVELEEGDSEVQPEAISVVEVLLRPEDAEDSEAQRPGVDLFPRYNLEEFLSSQSLILNSV